MERRHRGLAVALALALSVLLGAPDGALGGQQRAPEPDPRMHLDRIVPGTRLVYASARSTVKRSIVTIAEVSDKGAVIEGITIHLGRESRWTVETDSGGNRRSVTTERGSVTRYEPHDCARSFGRCEYVEIGADGERRHFISKLFRVGEVYRQVIFPAGAVGGWGASIEFTLDDDGLVVRRAIGMSLSTGGIERIERQAPD